jgi:crotonobetainyl-CoA:carnitine CoA-transferase CaiB-like acyl-CoA transferase
VTNALDGIRVIDLTVWFQGPVAAQHLADFGADVIKIERPQGGDLARGVRSIKAVPVGDWNQYFLVINRNKKSMAVDLKTERGREILHKLVEDSDVFLSNLSPGNLAAWQLSYEELKDINPRLVYAMTTGYGPHGEITKPSFDMTVQALTGLMARQGEPGQPPIYLGMGSGDAIGGLMAALGILIALRHRDKTGLGQYLDASLYGAQLFLGAPSLQGYLAGDKSLAKQRSRTDALNPLWNTYEASDRWLMLCLENDDANWQKLAGTLGGAMADDDRFASAEQRETNNSDLIAALDAALPSKTADEWTSIWQSLGIPVSPIRNLQDLADDPQAWENDYFVDAYCEEVQRDVKVRGMPISLSKTPGKVRTLGPELGQHTEEILTEMLGYSWEDVVELKEQGAIL